ncbi:hypothetical protein B0H16DRAFT_1742331 [Mycena metata]|uniref:MYND-type domain-containing protein n=1 Tax=Mycena metata TaxID=1033252 RepID=A0AAD7MFV3_9AGAR|nr:hypothetical protein B0H16DRAFT_1742331 [Mycena metata]
MHDCLHLRNLSKLKTAGMRSSARAAAAGSLPDLVALCDSLGDLPEMQALLTLPALFANADRQRIPNSAELDTLSSREMSIPHVDGPFQALMGFGVLVAAESIPLGAAADLWPHLWGWLDFLHTHWDYLPASRCVDQRRVCMHHAAIILALLKAHDTSTIIRATPGVRSLLATAWKGMIDDDALFACSAAGTLDLISASHFEEVVDGVGGTIQDLASTIIRHLSRAVPHPELKITAKFVVVCFGFLHSGCAGSPQLRRALCSIDFFTPLINTLTALHGTPALEAPWMCLNHLVGMLEGSAEIAAALKSGLLRITVAIAASIAPVDRNEANKISLLIIGLLQNLLPQSLVHYTVLVQLKKCFPSCLAFATASKIEVSAFSQDWRDFSTLAQKRLQFLDSWEARAIPSLKACDNTECGKIDSVHWNAAHRKQCQGLRSTRLTETLSTRSKSFWRALLNADYRHLMIDIYYRQVLFMHEHPGEAFLTMLSYMDVSGAKFDVLSPSVLKRVTWGAQMHQRSPEVVLQTRRIERHLVIHYDGHTIRQLLVPMHLATSELPDQLLSIAQLLPPGTTEEDAFEIVKAPLEDLVWRIQKTLVFTH